MADGLSGFPDPSGRPDGSPIRRYVPGDRDALYRVCLLTGDSGSDASALYSDPRLLGEVFVGPYLELDSEFAFVLDDGAGAEGYVLGALDTRSFERRCAKHWWPAVRERYRDFHPVDGMNDGWLLQWIASPPTSGSFATEYPSHLHIDLLPRWQSGGWGRRLMERLWAALSDAGSTGVHLGVGVGNTRAIGFYKHLGFTVLDSDDSTVWMGKRL